jgi:hypothetical protein
VRMLLEKGPEVNVQGGRYGNASQAASLKGHEKIVQLLLDEGANARDLENRNEDEGRKTQKA